MHKIKDLKKAYEQEEYGTYRYHSLRAKYHRAKADQYGRLSIIFLIASCALLSLSLLIRVIFS